MKKKLPMIGLIAAPYVLGIIISIVSFFAGSVGEENINTIEIVLNTVEVLYQVFLCLMILFNMVWAFRLQKLGYTEKQLFFWNMIIKLCYILVYATIFLTGLVMFFLPFGIMIIPILMLYDYVMLLPSTMYGISGLLLGRRQKNISRKKLVINLFCQFIFCLDTVSAIYLFVSAWKEEQKNRGEQTMGKAVFSGTELYKKSE